MFCSNNMAYLQKFAYVVPGIYCTIHCHGTVLEPPCPALYQGSLPWSKLCPLARLFCMYYSDIRRRNHAILPAPSSAIDRLLVLRKRPRCSWARNHNSEPLSGHLGHLYIPSVSLEVHPDCPGPGMVLPSSYQRGGPSPKMTPIIRRLCVSSALTQPG